MEKFFKTYKRKSQILQKTLKSAKKKNFYKNIIIESNLEKTKLKNL